MTDLLQLLNQWDTDLLLAINGWHNGYWDTFCMPSAASGCGCRCMPPWRTCWPATCPGAPPCGASWAWPCASRLPTRWARPSSAPGPNALRPANPENPISDLVHIVNGYRGGRYGFPSCHAANTFGAGLLPDARRPPQGVDGAARGWALVTCYSRAYLGVHYPGDLLAGALLGLAGAALCYTLFRLVARYKRPRRLPAALGARAGVRTDRGRDAGVRLFLTNTYIYGEDREYENAGRVDERPAHVVGTSLPLRRQYRRSVGGRAYHPAGHRVELFLPGRGGRRHQAVCTRSARMWSTLLVERKAVHHLLHVVPGILIYLLLPWPLSKATGCWTSRRGCA